LGVTRKFSLGEFQFVIDVLFLLSGNSVPCCVVMEILDDRQKVGLCRLGSPRTPQNFIFS